LLGEDSNGEIPASADYFIRTIICDFKYIISSNAICEARRVKQLEALLAKGLHVYGLVYRLSMAFADSKKYVHGCCEA
jgi:hypothetical protein